jgi:hypothetical protein
MESRGAAAVGTPRTVGNPTSPSATTVTKKISQNAVNTDGNKKLHDQPIRDEFTKASFTAAQKTLREQR